MPKRDSKRIERALTRQALANEPREMQSEITPVESQQAGEREVEAVRRAEETARGGTVPPDSWLAPDPSMGR